MKKLYAILGITLLTLLYCTTISLTGNYFHEAAFSVTSAPDKEKSDVWVSIKQFSNTVQAESIGNNFSNTLPTTLKDSKNQFAAIVKIRELFFANEFSQYIFTASNFLIKYGKSNIIFPFHYFW